MAAEEPRSGEAPNPYAPPKTTPPAPASAVARGGPTYTVDAESKIPPVCLKCGSTDGIVRRKQQFTWSSAARGIGLSGGVVGAVIASATRGNTDLLLPILVVVGVVLGIVVWVVNKSAKRASLELPLCASCEERWRAGVTIRRWLLAGLAVAFVPLLYGLLTHTVPVTAVGGALLVVMIAAAFAAKLPARFLGAQRIEGSLVTLTGVAPAAIAVLEQGGPPKKAKKKKNALQ